MNNSFSHKLKKLLTDKNVEQLEVCKATGISTSSFCHYLSGKRKPKYENLVKIARYFNVPVTYFGEEYAFAKESTSFVSEQIADYLVSTPDQDDNDLLTSDILEIIKSSGIIDPSAPLSDDDKEFVRQVTRKAVEIALLSLKK